MKSKRKEHAKALAHARGNRGQLWRVSDDVYDHYFKMKNRGESWDNFFRRLANLTMRNGFSPNLIEGYILKSTSKFYPRAAIARGDAIKEQVRKGLEKPDTPIKVREVL